MRKILLALALVLGGLAAVSPASPVNAAPIPTSYTDCNAAAWYGGTFVGSRVCIDETTPYGPVLYIYSDAGFVTSWGVSFNSQAWGSYGSGPCNSFIEGPNWYWATTSQTTFTDMFPRCVQSQMYTSDFSWWPSANVIRMTAAQHDQIELYSNAAGYELVWAD